MSHVSSAPTVELILAQFATFADRVQPSLASFKQYFPEAFVTLYTDGSQIAPAGIDIVRRVRPPFAGDDQRYGWRSSDLYKVTGLLESQADIAIAVDCDMFIVSDDVRTLIPLTQRFGVCLPANPRLLVKTDTLIGTDTDGRLDETLGCGFALNSSPIALSRRHTAAREFLEAFRREMVNNPVRAPLALWRASWTCGFAPYLLPFQWCVCQEHVGVGGEIILHMGHEKVRTFYASRTGHS
jgi:hypothetical protein